MEQPPQVLDSEPRFEGRVFSVRTDTMRDGEKTYELDIIDHAPSFAVAPIVSPGRLILVRQYRHATGRFLWEIPAGKAEGDEPVEQGARRELEEETGYTAGRLEHLISAYPTPGFCNELLHVYAAYDLGPGKQHFDEDENIEVREFSFAQAWSMQASGEVADMKTVLALLWLADGLVKKET